MGKADRLSRRPDWEVGITKGHLLSLCLKSFGFSSKVE